MLQRKTGIFDAAMVLRAAAAAAITTHGDSLEAPDYESAAIDLGPGEFIGRVAIRNIALTVTADTLVWFLVIGMSDDGTSQVCLGAIPIGDKDVTPNSMDLPASGVEIRDLSIYFSNAALAEQAPSQGLTLDRMGLWPKIKLAAVVVDDASAALDFEAEVYRIN